MGVNRALASLFRPLRLDGPTAYRAAVTLHDSRLSFAPLVSRSAWITLRAHVALSAEIQAALRRENLGRAEDRDACSARRCRRASRSARAGSCTISRRASSRIRNDWVSAEVANGPLAGRTLHELVDEFGADAASATSRSSGRTGSSRS